LVWIKVYVDSRSNWCGLKSMWTIGLIVVDSRFI
jgi:hypothetical protein